MRAVQNDPVLVVGQVWEDYDKRVRDSATKRRVRIVEVLPNGAIVENIETGKRTGILLRRFRPTSTGYRLVEDDSAHEAVGKHADLR